MKTIKLRIKKFNCLKELKQFNSILRYSFNRFQDNLSEKEIRILCKNKFIDLNSWFVQCAIKEGKAVYKKFKDRKIIFGGKFNLKQYMRKLISKKDYYLNKLAPITIQGEACKKGNRLFNFDFLNSKLELKLSKKEHKIIEIPSLRKNYKREFSQIQNLVNENKLTVTIKFNQDYIWFIYDESLLNEEKFKNLKLNRVLGIDLNPNYIGLSILEFNNNDKFKVLHKQVFDLNTLNITSKKSSESKESKYLTNKRNYELIQICYEINKLINLWKCSKLCIEDLNIKSVNQYKGKTLNRLCNNVWNRNLIVNKLQMLATIYGYELVKVNPVYSSFIGNILYGNENTPDMVASSIEIARRGYKKYMKGWFYPIFNVESIDERWKQTLAGIKDWKQAFTQIKKSKLKYRFQLIDFVNNAVFSKFYLKKLLKVYFFI